MPYLHFPAQSGSNEVLKRMRRGYTHERYLELVQAAREAVPEMGLAGDTIVGFCGETDADFERTIELHEKTRYQNAYIFMYSERDYTPAKDGGMADDVPFEVKKERVNRLLELQRQWSLEENRKRVGTITEVFGEGASKRNPDRQEGRNPQHQIVIVETPRDLKGQFYKAEITKATDAALYGKLV
jgi:tRNA-2-methylthio-N6-dimethylallyladenosine synthase